MGGIAKIFGHLVLRSRHPMTKDGRAPSRGGPGTREVSGAEHHIMEKTQTTIVETAESLRDLGLLAAV